MTIARQTALRFNGAIADLSADDRTALLDRSTSLDARVRDTAATILADVRRRGDDALRDLAERFDGVRLDAFEISNRTCRAALDALDPSLRAAMSRAAANVERAHRATAPVATECETEPGVVVGRRPDPLDRVGVYAPGGRAAYPSSVLMGAVPARAAGVREVILCSPPQRDGLPPAIVLAAAALAGIDRVFSVGGAGAIAAMAYGTRTIPRVDRIVGPGNAYVAEAKLQVVGAVSIDAPAGPSELLVIADDSCTPERIALEMAAQAEHDPDACVVCVAIGSATADAIRLALDEVIERQPRFDIVVAALAANGGVLVADSIAQAIELANVYAPEHLLLAVRDADRALDSVRNAGTVFVGESASVAFGDYMTGANHVLPTGGACRSYSGLSPLDFVRWTTHQRVSPAAAASLAPAVARFADAEDLPGHAAAARAAGGGR